MPKCLPPLPLKTKPQNAVFYSDRPCYPANDSDALVPLSTTENVIMDSIDALMAYTTQAQRISAWKRKSKKTMIEIMKSLRYVRVAWTSIECRVMIVSTMFDGQQNVYIGFINRQYDSNIEQPFNSAYLRVGEMTDLSICGVNFGNRYEIQTFDSSFVTLKKMDSLPFPVCDNELVTTSSFEDIRNVLNLKNEDSVKLWNRMTVREQKIFLENCMEFELPWGNIRSENFTMSCPSGYLWNGLFHPSFHADCAKQLLETHEDVYDEPPVFADITIVLDSRAGELEWYPLEGRYEITGSNSEYVSLQRLPDDESEQYESDDSLVSIDLTQRV